MVSQLFSDAAERSPAAGPLRPSPRTTVEACAALDVSMLTRLCFAGAGVSGMAEFTWPRPGPPLRALVRVWFPVATVATRAQLDVEYADPGDRRLVVDRFEYAATAPHLGGLRWWVECTCGRRCRVLYVAPGARGFRCRSCHGLAYRSQRVGRRDRLYRRAGVLAARIGCHSGYRPHPSQKPKWMRWRTYNRLHLRVLELSLDALCADLDPAVLEEVGVADRAGRRRRVSP